MKEGKENFYVWQEMFNLIMIYLKVSMPHVVSREIQRSCTATPGLKYLQVAPRQLTVMLKMCIYFKCEL